MRIMTSLRGGASRFAHFGGLTRASRATDDNQDDRSAEDEDDGKDASEDDDADDKPAGKSKRGKAKRADDDDEGKDASEDDDDTSAEDDDDDTSAEEDDDGKNAADDDEDEMKGKGAVAQARRREQSRIAHILGHKAAAHNPVLAVSLACTTRMTRREAVEQLKGGVCDGALPPETIASRPDDDRSKPKEDHMPTVPPLIENRREGGYVVWDPSDGMLTREAGLIQAGAGVCITGLVMGALLTAGVAAAAALGVNVGNGAMSAIVVGPGAKVGDYKLIVIDPANNAGAFIVEDPNGVEVGHGNVGVAFNAGGLQFTLADGAADFVAGDSFTISVAGSAKYVPWDPTANNGAQNVAAILWSSYRDATAADRRAVLNVRGPMKVQAAELTWGANVTTDVQRASALAALAKLGILNV